MLVLGCAVESTPPGGELDRETPRLSVTSPADSATRVALGSPIVIVWTEPMDRRASERALVVVPPIRWARVSWERSTLTLVPADSLEPGRTYVVVAGRSSRDRHENTAGKAFSFAFTTGDSLPQGTLAGRVAPLAGNEAARVFAMPADGNDTTVVSLREGDFRSAAETDSGGVFVLRYLDPGVRYRVAAFVDRDASGSFTPDGGDSWGYAARLASPVDSLGELVVALMDPNREGFLRGVVIGDRRGGGQVLIIARPEADSLKTVAGTPDSVGGRFLVAAHAGRYRVGAFRDIDGNGRYDSVRVAPEPAPAPRDTALTSPPDTSVTVPPDTTTVAVVDTTAAPVDTAVAVVDTSATPVDTTAVAAPLAPPSPPLPPDVVEWLPDAVEVVAGEVSPYLTVSAPPVPARSDSTDGPP